MRMFGRALGWGLAGVFLVPMAVFLLMVVVNVFDSQCGAGDSGGCAMGTVVATAVAALPGAVLFFTISLGRQIRAAPGKSADRI